MNSHRHLFALLIAALFSLPISGWAQHESDEQQGDTTHSEGMVEHAGSSHEEGHGTFDPTATALHHIADANVFTILDFIRIPLPMILYSQDDGLDVFSSGRFHPGEHDNGEYAFHRYVMFEGNVHRVKDWSFPNDLVEIGPHSFTERIVDNDEVVYLNYQGQEYPLDHRSTLDNGLFGGKITSFYDFSITKNVLTMILVAIILFWLFRQAAVGYTRREGKAPSGVQSWLEPVFTFIRDEVAIPFIGKDRYLKYIPLLMSLFFFILGLNLFGQIPFLGSANVTGNLTVTGILAILVFLVVTFSGKKHYWQHIFWMPGVPVFVKPLLAFVEFMGVFIKPLTLMLRLAGNIVSGHIAILSFIGLIFIFGKAGESMGGSLVGTAMSVPLTMFMMAIELIVAFVQAFVFTILTASYIGAAIEDGHH